MKRYQDEKEKKSKDKTLKGGMEVIQRRIFPFLYTA